MADLAEYLQSQSYEEEEKPARLSLHLIVKRHLPPEAKHWDHEKIVGGLNKITHLRLDRERIKEIDSLELLGNSVTNIYLQCNWIECIENLECLTNIKFLTLANNRIKIIENLYHLKKLLFLDISENNISSVDTSEIPQSVIILNLLKNPCTDEPNYRQHMIQSLPKLQQLDLCEVTNSEKRDVGLEVSSDEEEEDEEEEEIETGEPDRLSKLNNVKDEDFHEIATRMMISSQNRLESELLVHKKHESELSDLRVSWNVPESARTSRQSKVFTKKKSSNI